MFNKAEISIILKLFLMLKILAPEILENSIESNISS